MVNNFFIVQLLVLPVFFAHANGRHLPVKSRFKDSDEQQTQQLRQLLENELLPIKQEFHKIEHALNLDETPKDKEMRFKQVDAQPTAAPDYTGMPQAGDIAKAMKALKDTLKPGAMDALSTIINMFHDKGVQSHLSAQGASASPEKVTSLISSALANQPNLDHNRMNKLLENWKNQLAGPDFANMQHPNMPQQQPMMAPQPSFMQIPQYFPFAAVPQMMMPFPVQPMMQSGTGFYPAPGPMAAPMKPLQFPPAASEFSNANDFKLS